MPQYFVDDTPRPLDSGLKTWGELLETVDDELAPGRRVVTAVRFDGVDQPSFRTPDLAGRDVAGLGRLDLETIHADELIKATIDAGRSGLATLVAQAQQVADGFRGAGIPDANRQLQDFVEAIRQLTVLTGAVGDVAGVNLELAPCGTARGSDLIDGVGVTLRRLLDAHASRDWITAADCLEYELAPAVQRWSALFDALDGGAR